MKHDDLLYVAFFYFSLAAAIIDKCYVIDKHKGKYGAAVGFTALLFLCGSEIVYPLVNIIVNTVIICCSTKRRSGIFAFSFTCSYLFYFRYYCSASSITNMFMMSTTLRMVSIAMDSSEKEDVSVQNEARYDIEYRVTPERIIFYALHHVGLVGVPYYTYKTYCQYLILPFKNHPGEWKYKSVICVIDSHLIMFGRYLMNYLYPFSYALTDEFYERSILFRMWYIYPVGFDFILRISNAFVLTNASCYINGMGAYPDFTKPKCGHGPTENLEKMLRIFWHGLQIGNFSSMFFSSVIFHIEERWEFILKDRELSTLGKHIRLVLKLHILYNLIFTFVCQEWSLIARYQTSVYWNSVVLLLLLLLSSLLLAKKKTQ